MNTAQSLIIWYKNNKRDLPWRKTKDPYKIWLSEIILQQTRVNQGLQYYLSFIENFPKLEDLAKASEERVLKLWQGLGYYSRARNLHYTAKLIVEKYDAKFPEKYDEIINLKGVGEYTAAAIASFSYNQPYPVIDGNVKRVIARLFNIDKPIDSLNGIKEIKFSIESIFDTKNPALFNQAIMEFGAIQCVPKKPQCAFCPLKEKCLAFTNNNVSKLPFKEKKVKIRNRYLYYLVVRQNDFIYISKRNNNDIWRNMYDFPAIEFVKNIPAENIFEMKEFQQFMNNHGYTIINISNQIKHVLSHQRLFIQFIELELKNNAEIQHKAMKRIPLKEIANYPVPVVISNFIKNSIHV